MGTTLCLLRHGLASGHGPDAPLLHEGEQHVRALGRRLAGEGFRPARAFCSPYRRARDTAAILLSETAPGLAAEHRQELTPDHDPGDLIETLAGMELPAARVLLVAHLPLLARLVHKLAHEVVAISPGTLVEVEVDGTRHQGRVARIIGPGGVEG